MALDTFERGATIRFKVTFKNTAETVTDPTNNLAYCTIFNPAATKKVDSQEGERESTGVYYYDYTIPKTEALGIWKVEWEGNVATLTSIGRKQFKIVHTVPGAS